MFTWWALLPGTTAVLTMNSHQRIAALLLILTGAAHCTCCLACIAVDVCSGATATQAIRCRASAAGQAPSSFQSTGHV
eukprot:m.655232 g.655232  ORF g.655232 m.655232 type:complete len:78 (+) comp22696_c0_seq2:2803-3036(+)